MSQLNVDNIKDRSGSTLGPTFPNGMRVAAGSTLNVYGDMVVEGTQTVINSDILDVKDKTVGIASTSNPTALTQDGAGIEIYGPSNVTLTYSGQKSGVGINTGLDVAGFGTFSGSVTATGAVSGSTFTGTGAGAASFGGNLSVGSSIGAGGSVTASIFYGSSAGLTNLPDAPTNSVDMWTFQFNDNNNRRYQMKVGTNANYCGNMFVPVPLISHRPNGFPNAIGMGITFCSQVCVCFCNNCVYSNLKSGEPDESMAAIAKFPATGAWEIEANMLILNQNVTQWYKFGMQCTSNLGAGTTTWTGLYPYNWNSNENNLSAFGGGQANEILSTCSTGAVNRVMRSVVSVADTSQSGIRFQIARQASGSFIEGGSFIKFTHLTNTAPW